MQKHEEVVRDDDEMRLLLLCCVSLQESGENAVGLFNRLFLIFQTWLISTLSMSKFSAD